MCEARVGLLPLSFLVYGWEKYTRYCLSCNSAPFPFGCWCASIEKNRCFIVIIEIQSVVFGVNHMSHVCKRKYCNKTLSTQQPEHIKEQKGATKNGRERKRDQEKGILKFNCNGFKAHTYHIFWYRNIYLTRKKNQRRVYYRGKKT